VSTWLAQLAAAQSNQPAAPPYLDPAKPISQRVDDLIGRMTLEEKASQVINHASAIPRLNIPQYDWWSEALHGVAAPNQPATVFPEPIGLAASFNSALIHRMAEVIGDEGRVNYNMAVRAGRRATFEGLTFYAPNINIFRDPRWGRGQETYGEDPFLTARMGVAFITGLQGDDPRNLRAAATAKHYAVHSGPEPARHGFDARVSRHDEGDTYLPAFRAAVVEGKVASVMCVYNAINGVPGCANDFLLKETLRGQWNFKGFVASDCNAVSDIYEGHHNVKSAVEAGAAAVKAGMDSECEIGASNLGDQKYVEAVKRGLLSEQDLDRPSWSRTRRRLTPCSIATRIARSRCKPRANPWCCSKTMECCPCRRRQKRSLSWVHWRISCACCWATTTARHRARPRYLPESGNNFPARK
jgi:beta-glucosidase